MNETNCTMPKVGLYETLEHLGCDEETKKDLMAYYKEQIAHIDELREQRDVLERNVMAYRIVLRDLGRNEHEVLY